MNKCRVVFFTNYKSGVSLFLNASLVVCAAVSVRIKASVYALIVYTSSVVRPDTGRLFVGLLSHTKDCQNETKTNVFCTGEFFLNPSQIVYATVSPRIMVSKYV